MTLENQKHQRVGSCRATVFQGSDCSNHRQMLMFQGGWRPQSVGAAVAFLIRVSTG